MKPILLYKGIQTFVPVEPVQAGAADVGTDIVDEKCTLRFPFFNRTFDDKAWDEDDIGSYEGDALDHFPVISEVWTLLIKDKYNAFPMSPGDSHFWKSLKSCSANEIYFLDAHFSLKNLLRLCKVLKDMDRQRDRRLTDVCIYMKKKNEWEGLKQKFDELKRGGTRFEKITLTIYCLRPALSEKLHDRFALLGENLWHFGASAGAMHTDINAYSGPWHDRNGKCMEFMREVRKYRLFIDEVSTALRGTEQ